MKHVAVVAATGGVLMLPFRQCLLVLSLLFIVPGSMTSAFARSASEQGEDFSRKTVVERARVLSEQPYEPPAQAPESLTSLDYSQYRMINFQQKAAIWGDTKSRFSIQLFAPGFLYHDLIDINVVENGKSYPLRVSEKSFRVPDPALTKVLQEVGKFAGLRLHYPLNTKEYDDEFLVFQGASYFRGVAKGQLYGLSARGLAIDVAGQEGEEHPIFREFWVERPSSKDESIVVHALLDSRRVTGAYRFAIFPGPSLHMDTEVVLFPREDLDHVGLAPLTSMFMHGPLDHSDRPDYRPAVHDSEGLAIKRGNGERIWRPLANPRELQVSAFVDENPVGFGLIQRERGFHAFQDMEANYHRRPSAWVEPVGEWGKGYVSLVEIPSDFEGNDNIVVYWRPEQGLRKGEQFEYAYRLSWRNDTPTTRGIAPVVRSAGGHKLRSDHPEVMIDYSDLTVDNLDDLIVNAEINPGRILESRVQPNPAINGVRVLLSLASEEPAAEIRVGLKIGDKPVAETWLYRWLNDY